MKLLLTTALLMIVSIHSIRAQDTSRVQHKRPIIDTTDIQDSSLDRITFTKVEIEAEFPGGSSAWLRYLVRNLRYPDSAINHNIQGKVWVQFIVDMEGNVSDVRAVDGPTQGGLREEAVRLIKRSGKWTPAIQNGRQVRSYKKMPIFFKLEG